VLSDGSLSIFWSNGLVGSICGLAVFMLLWPAISAGLRRLRPATSQGQAAE
jgi:putative tricarboxylic transport membrane protein